MSNISLKSTEIDKLINIIDDFQKKIKQILDPMSKMPPKPAANTPNTNSQPKQTTSILRNQTLDVNQHNFKNEQDIVRYIFDQDSTHTSFTSQEHYLAQQLESFSNLYKGVNPKDINKLVEEQWKTLSFNIKSIYNQMDGKSTEFNSIINKSQNNTKTEVKEEVVNNFTQQKKRQEDSESDNDKSNEQDANKFLESDEDNNADDDQKEDGELEQVNMNKSSKISNIRSKTTDLTKYENIVSSLQHLIDNGKIDVIDCHQKHFRMENRTQECYFKYYQGIKIENKQLGRQDSKLTEQSKKIYVKWFKILQNINIYNDDEMNHIKKLINQMFNEKLI